MADSVPYAVQSCHDLSLWLIPQLDKFPRAQRFVSVGGFLGCFGDRTQKVKLV
jgi:hypothetical protein